MREEHAAGLTVDWLNSWMAAIGVCVLVPEARLCWTDDPVPTACFALSAQAPQLVELVVAALPSAEGLAQLAIARRRDGYVELGRKVSLVQYAGRAALARQTRDMSLSSTVTDLVADTQLADDLPHSPFDPPVPRGITLWERAVSCRKEIADPVAEVAATFAGRGHRTPVNGLGFDVRRLIGGVQDAEKRVDPVIELLAFLSLRLFPMRGNGSEALARGWHGPAGRPGSFRWCAWAPGLDLWGIDALLDLLPQARTDAKLAKRLGVSAWYRSVPYRWQSSSDTTRAYGAEPDL
jgi:hypothetical protein